MLSDDGLYARCPSLADEGDAATLAAVDAVHRRGGRRCAGVSARRYIRLQMAMPSRAE